ncbi:SDR family oxidoreductase [Rubritalea marina]|uniref:SDR family oxidoreductase n=1 Tax=Rubritalea marina TaxID=361055 RepID=UPI000369D88C|nr:SDR family oxidoreductase [Rubritalea marina]
MSYLDSLFNLKGKVAVVLGGTGDLCGQIAMGLAKAGCQVVLSGRDELKAFDRVEAIEAEGGTAYFVEAEVTESGSLEALVDIVSERSGRIDILINGAAINSRNAMENVSEDELTKIFDVNFNGTFRACQIFSNYFKQHDRPTSIINIGSISGINPLSDRFVQSASKAAIHNLTRNLAREWAEFDIRVNTLIPGFFPAKQSATMLDDARVLEILRQTPASRFGNPEELVGATLLLASPSASSFITGSEIVVDGGFSTTSI